MTHQHTLKGQNSRGGLNLDNITSIVDLDILKWKLSQARARQNNDQIEAGEEAEYEVFKSLLRICDNDPAHIALGIEETKAAPVFGPMKKILSVME